MGEEKNFRRNPSPEKQGHKAIAVVQNLSFGSLLPLISVFLKQGPFSICYFKTSRGGLRLGALLYFFRISVSSPLKINDLFFVDTPYVHQWKIQYEAIKTCRDQLDSIETKSPTLLPAFPFHLSRPRLHTNITVARQPELGVPRAVVAFDFLWWILLTFFKFVNT